MSSRSAGSLVARRGGGSRLFAGRKLKQLAQHGEALLVVMREEMRDARDLVVRGRAAQFFLRHLLVRHGLDDVRAGDEHVARSCRP